jgi:hypothetical protein
VPDSLLLIAAMWRSGLSKEWKLDVRIVMIFAR